MENLAELRRTKTLWEGDFGRGERKKEALLVRTFARQNMSEGEVFWVVFPTCLGFLALPFSSSSSHICSHMSSSLGMTAFSGVGCVM